MEYQPSTSSPPEQNYLVVAAAVLGAALIAFLVVSVALEFATSIDVPFVNWPL
jgi:hypothetical protein